MKYRGHVKNGQISLDEPEQLPEGAVVNVVVEDENVGVLRERRTRRIRLDPVLARQIATLRE